MRSIMIIGLVLISRLAFSQDKSNEYAIKKYGIDTILVVATTPTTGSELPASKIAGFLSTITKKKITEYANSDMHTMLLRELPGVTIQSPDGNFLRQDVSYRGFSATSLLGVSSGIAVFLDGVRMNQTFGDVIDWEFINMVDLASLSLLPNFVASSYGTNTMGGVISIATLNGFSAKGLRLNASYNGFINKAYGGINVSGNYGYSDNDHAFYASARYVKDEGWRKFSPTTAGNALLKYTRLKEDSKLELAVHYAYGDLIGNGPSLKEILDEQRDAVFTNPDQRKKHLALVKGSFWKELFDDIHLDGTVHYKYSNVLSINGDRFELDGAELHESEAQKFRQRHRLSDDDDSDDDNDSDNDDDSDDKLGVYNQYDLQTHSFGLSIQMDIDREIFGLENQALIGVNFYGGISNYGSYAQLGNLDKNLTVVLYNPSEYVFPYEADKSKRAISLGEFKYGNYVVVESFNYSLYLSDQLSITDRMLLSLSYRLNYSTVSIKDRLFDAEEKYSANGYHEYLIHAASLGLSYDMWQKISVYSSLSLSGRAPTPLELTCANEEAPCSLPNALLDDPALEAPLSLTFEIGLKRASSDYSFGASFYYTNVYNDIYFTNVSFTRGYFRNVGIATEVGTRRLGVDVDGRINILNNLYVSASYVWNLSTFESSNFETTDPNPENEEATIPIKKGSIIPLSPQHVAKLILGGSLFKGLWTWDVSLSYTSTQRLRRDEANTYPEVLSDYLLLSTYHRFKLGDHVSLFIQVTNVPNITYNTFGLIGAELDEVYELLDKEPAEKSDPRFLTPGPPLHWVLGIELNFF